MYSLIYYCVKEKKGNGLTRKHRQFFSANVNMEIPGWKGLSRLQQSRIPFHTGSLIYWAIEMYG